MYNILFFSFIFIEERLQALIADYFEQCVQRNFKTASKRVVNSSLSNLFENTCFFGDIGLLLEYLRRNF